MSLLTSAPCSPVGSAVFANKQKHETEHGRSQTGRQEKEDLPSAYKTLTARRKSKSNLDCCATKLNLHSPLSTKSPLKMYVSLGPGSPHSSSTLLLGRGGGAWTRHAWKWNGMARNGAFVLLGTQLAMYMYIVCQPSSVQVGYRTVQIAHHDHAAADRRGRQPRHAVPLLQPAQYEVVFGPGAGF